jgi:hypothetical protein
MGDASSCQGRFVGIPQGLSPVLVLPPTGAGGHHPDLDLRRSPTAGARAQTQYPRSRRFRLLRCAQTARRGGAASGFSIALPATHAKPARSFRPTAAAHGGLSVAASTGVKFSGNFSPSRETRPDDGWDARMRDLTPSLGPNHSAISLRGHNADHQVRIFRKCKTSSC